MKSMTGFAKEQSRIGNKIITIEIKTLNSKTLDITIKLPNVLHDKELELRAMLCALERGKIEVTINMENASDAPTELNETLLTHRYQAIRQAAEKVGCPTDHLFDTLIAQPDIWIDNTSEELSEEEWEAIANCFKKAIHQVDEFRLHEGKVLQQDFDKHVNLIERTLEKIPQFESERIETAKNRIHKYFEECAIKEIDRDRFEQELIYYLEKLDITEEKVRLAKHIAYFREAMVEDNSGKKLGFVAQEMGREINTTGSKANHIEIQKRVVIMKDELEKIKEQLGNIL